MASQEARKILELGCGFAKTPGAIGVDIIPGCDAEIIHNLDVFPYPFADNEWDEVICQDVLEHVEDFVGSINEIWRICKPGAKIIASGPFMSSVNFFSDPTHKRAFTSRSFDYFIPGTLAYRFGYSKATFEMTSCEYDKHEIALRRGWHRWALNWANRNKPEYENRYAFLYPVYQIYFELKVIK